MNAFCSVMGDEPIPLARLDAWDVVLPAAINEGLLSPEIASEPGRLLPCVVSIYVFGAVSARAAHTFHTAGRPLSAG